jgi:PAS domain S-box-containing protein
VKWTNPLKLSLYQKAIALLSITFFVQIGLFVWYGKLVSYVENLEAMEARSRLVVGHLNWLSVLVDNAVLGRLGQSGPTKSIEYYKIFAQAHDQIPSQLKSLKDLFVDDPAQLKNVQKLESLTTGLLHRLDESEAWSGPEFFEKPEIKAITTEIPSTRREILSIEEKRFNLDFRQALPEARTAVKTQIAVAVLLNIAGALMLMMVFTRTIALRLKVISENSMRLTRRESLLKPLPGADEISQLDQTLHSVAAQLKELARRERAIIDNAVDVICSIDEQGKFTEVSPASQIHWGKSPAKLLGTPYTDVVDPTTLPLTLENMAEVKSTGRTISFDNRVKCADTFKDMLWSCSWSATERAFFCTVHDVSERKQMDLLKQQFVAMVGHDLRSPLTSIRLYFDSLESGVYGSISDSLRKMSNVAMRNTVRLIELVNDLLDIEKFESGTFDLNLESIDLDSVLNDTVESMRQIAKESKVSIDLAETSERLMADPERLTQVFVNLLSNAIKYSPAGGKISVYCQRIADQVEVSFEDEGRGIDAKFHKIIFDRFKQTEQSDSQRGRGTGLGLAICKAIVEQHHGSIGVVSEVGKGSRFWVKLPVEQSTGAAL